MDLRFVISAGRLRTLRRTRVALSAFSLAAWAALLPACGGDDPVEDPYASSDKFCDNLATAQCEVAESCAATTDGCKTARKRLCLETATRSSTGTRTYRAQNADACIRATVGAYTDKALKPEELDATVTGSMAELCERVFEGSIPKDQACASAFECAPGLVCAKVPTGTTQVCAPRVDKKLDEGCANTGELCAKGSFCGESPSGLRCVRKRGPNEACSDKLPCNEDTRCDVASPNPTCQPRSALGGACTTADDCVSAAPLCVVTSDGGKCLAAVQFAAVTPVCREYGGQ